MPSVYMDVVFVDIEKYSRRKSTYQKKVIEAFKTLLQNSLDGIAQKYIEYVQEHSFSFKTDIVKLPTGDGVALVFAGQGLPPTLHIDFAELLLSKIHRKNQASPCKKFEQNKFCDCHDNFRVRVGISEGQGIVYSDVNGNYNVAGDTINMAARVMGLADGMQILVNQVAYRNLTDIADIPDDKFRRYTREIKHGLKIEVYQYCPTGIDGVNCEEPSALGLNIRVERNVADLPAFIATDVEGCITPPQRGEVDLGKLQRLRTYCKFQQSEPGRGYPEVVIYTGRSQGYVELLAQTLGMVDRVGDLPFVIENGSALYFPFRKLTEPLISSTDATLIDGVRAKLMEAFPDNEFEPKAYMISINASANQTIDQLREKVFVKLNEWGEINKLTVNATATAVDITAKGIDKWTGLKHVCTTLSKSRNAEVRPESIVAFGDSTSDLCVIREVGNAYCSAYACHPEVETYIKKKFGSDHVLPKRDIDFVLAAIERVCGLRMV